MRIWWNRWFNYKNWLPGLMKSASHTIFIYGKKLILHFSCNSIRTEDWMKGLYFISFFSYMEIVWLEFFHKPKKKRFLLKFNFSNFLECIRNRTQGQNHGLLTKSYLIVSHLKCIGNDLSVIRTFLHKWYTESIKLLNFDKKFKDGYFQCLIS